MPKERKKYPWEFKMISIKLSNTRTHLDVLAKELNITPTLLYCWRQEYLSKNGSLIFPKKEKIVLSEAELELIRLKKEMRATEIEIEILKKVINAFSGNNS